MFESLRVCAMPLVGLLLVGASSTAHAADRVRQAGNIGVGLGANSFSFGLTGKYFVNDANAFQATVGGREDGQVLLGVDYLYNFDPLWSDETAALGWYAGFGGSISPGSQQGSLIAAGIVGLDFDIDAAPLDIFVELRPSFLLAPVGDLKLFAAGGGVRYYF